MRFGYFYNIHDPTKTRDYGDLIREMRETAIYCDKAGFDVFWVPEHHFSIWGRELSPNPILLAADIAAHTKRIRIGLSAAIVTFWHPLRVAEDIAVLDHLTGGRLECGVGRGNYGLEARNLNPPADPNNQMMNIKVFEETVEIIKRALTEERFSFKGDIYTFPSPGFSADRAHTVNDPAYVDPATNELIKLSIFPRSKQKPMPPMWQVVNSIESIQHAARLDMGIMMWRPTVEALKPKLRAYRETIKKNHGKDLPIGARAAILRDVYVAANEAEAVRIAKAPLMESLNFSNWRGPSIYLNPGETLDPATEAALKKELTFEFVRDRCLLIGSPDQVAGQLIHLHDETNIEQVVFKGGWPGLPWEREFENIKLLGEKVIPQVREALGTGARRAMAE